MCFQFPSNLLLCCVCVQTIPFLSIPPIAPLSHNLVCNYIFQVHQAELEAVCSFGWWFSIWNDLDVSSEAMCYIASESRTDLIPSMGVLETGWTNWKLGWTLRKDKLPRERKVLCHCTNGFYQDYTKQSHFGLCGPHVQGNGTISCTSLVINLANDEWYSDGAI